MKIVMKGKIHRVGQVEDKGKQKSFLVQDILLSKPTTDEFGDVIKENYYPLQLTGDDIKANEGKLKEGMKVTVTAFLNASEKDGKYFLNLRAKSFEVAEVMVSDAGPSTAMESESRMVSPAIADELPF